MTFGPGRTKTFQPGGKVGVHGPHRTEGALKATPERKAPDVQQPQPRNKRAGIPGSLVARHPPRLASMRSGDILDLARDPVCK